MPLVTFVKVASGATFGPYQVGDRASFSAQTITDLGDAVVPDNTVGDVANQPTGVE
jgi:hypothetical protein